MSSSTGWMAKWWVSRCSAGPVVAAVVVVLVVVVVVVV
jgi:hypothetical protein